MNTYSRSKGISGVYLRIMQDDVRTLLDITQTLYCCRILYYHMDQKDIRMIRNRIGRNTE